MVLTTKTPSVRWLSLPPSGFFSLLQLLEVGFFVSLMGRMLFFMAYWRRRFIYDSLLVFLILVVLIIYVVSPKHAMVRSKLPVLGMLILQQPFVLMVLHHRLLTHHYFSYRNL